MKRVISGNLRVIEFVLIRVNVPSKNIPYEYMEKKFFSKGTFFPSKVENFEILLEQKNVPYQSKG
jgi:hypothetical protein